MHAEYVQQYRRRRVYPHNGQLGLEPPLPPRLRLAGLQRLRVQSLHLRQRTIRLRL